jgi:hypothetical protein
MVLSVLLRGFDNQRLIDCSLGVRGIDSAVSVLPVPDTFVIIFSLHQLSPAPQQLVVNGAVDGCIGFGDNRLETRFSLSNIGAEVLF